MYCPKCRSEYIEGINKCDDCGAGLVESLAPQEPVEFKELVPIFTCNQSVEANFVKSILESSGIECSIENEHFISINVLMSAAIPIRVVVEKKNQSKAKEIITQYFKDIKE